jgi:hypothetical protein
MNSLTPAHRDVISAQPGLNVVMADEHGVFRIPLVAWLIEIFEFDDRPDEDFLTKRPITIQDKIDHLDYAIEYPGIPHLFGVNEIFDSEAEFLDRVERHTARR